MAEVEWRNGAILAKEKGCKVEELPRNLMQEFLGRAGEVKRKEL